MNRLLQLRDAGVSTWLDDLSRDLLHTGRFATLVSDWGISGATSNPTLFARAITGSDLYDTQLRVAVAAGIRDPQELFFRLALDDVRRASDLLRPMYEASGGLDGFVSFECTPHLANDADGTVAQAVELWHRLERPNVMIKVPATGAGVHATEELTVRGVNVNVTLLFSLTRYQQVIDAYIAGLERRLSAGQQVAGISSVASFFVSRVDGLADPMLPDGSDLRGRVATANAGRAYETFRRRFTDRRWISLQARGARAQRPLWASTAVKNQAYPDVLYVEGLVASDVITTMPEATLRAFADHGRVDRTLLADTSAAGDVLRSAAAAGVDLDAITQTLEGAGIDAFHDSYRELLGCLEASQEHAPRREQIQARIARPIACPTHTRRPVAADHGHPLRPVLVHAGVTRGRRSTYRPVPSGWGVYGLGASSWCVGVSVSGKAGARRASPRLSSSSLSTIGDQAEPPY